MKYIIGFLFPLCIIGSYGQKDIKNWPEGKWYTTDIADTSFVEFSEGSYTVNYELYQEKLELTGSVKRINRNTFEIIYSPKPSLEHQFIRIIDIQPDQLIVEFSTTRAFGQKTAFKYYLWE